MYMHLRIEQQPRINLRYHEVLLQQRNRPPVPGAAEVNNNNTNIGFNVEMHECCLCQR